MQITNIIDTIDRFQQRHPFVGLPYAIIKKFGDDDGGYQAALITYYGFLSLFPLLLVILTIIQLLFHNNLHVRTEVSQSIGHFFPGIGTALQNSLHTKSGTGTGLVIGLIVTIYGSRGVADVLRHTINNIWGVPRMRRTGFPKGMVHSLLIMAAATIGFGATIAVSSFSAVLGHAQWVKILANGAGFVVVFGVLLFVFRTASSRKIPYKDMLLGTSFAAAIIQFLLTFGSVLIARQLRNFDALYGTFAIVLGMLFWIYLLAQVIVYAVEIDSVRHLKLWPRALQNDKPTPQDLRAYEMYAHVGRYIPKEEIDVRFK